MYLEITHETTYRYQPPADTAQHVVHLRPREGRGQRVLAHRLDLQPMPLALKCEPDAFGNERCFFSLSSRHDALRIVAHSRVETSPAASSDDLPQTAWEDVAAAFRFRKHATWDAAVEFTFPSRHVQPHDDFLAYARTEFTSGRPLIDATVALMHRLHDDMRYVTHSTDIHTPARDALRRREGVCQDFSHIFISCLRSMGLPARYVSGYLLTHPPAGQPRLVGADASHAWVSAYLPGEAAGDGIWIDFDPTNDRWAAGSPGEDYVVLASGRDFADVSPVRGVIQGTSHHVMSVAVTVKPVLAAAT